MKILNAILNWLRCYKDNSIDVPFSEGYLMPQIEKCNEKKEDSNVVSDYLDEVKRLKRSFEFSAFVCNSLTCAIAERVTVLNDSSSVRASKSIIAMIDSFCKMQKEYLEIISGINDFMSYCENKPLVLEKTHFALCLLLRIEKKRVEKEWKKGNSSYKEVLKYEELMSV